MFVPMNPKLNVKPNNLIMSDKKKLYLIAKQLSTAVVLSLIPLLFFLSSRFFALIRKRVSKKVEGVHSLQFFCLFPYLYICIKYLRNGLDIFPLIANSKKPRIAGIFD